MHNRLVTDASREPGPSHRWDADHWPGLRLVVLWVSVLVPVVAILIRMGQLQLVLQNDFVDGFEQTYEVVEELPARNGRILGADGTVLAGDIDRYDLQVHYRLIERPADERWLRSEARRKLSAAERKKPERVAAEQQRIVERVQQQWEKLSSLTGTSPDRLEEMRQAVQQRVARIRAEVQRRRELKSSPVPEAQLAGSSAGSLWQRLREELTMPPSRSLESEPLVEEVGFHTVATDVGEDIRAEIEAHPERYPGVRIAVQSRRTYPRGELAGHLIGYRTPLTPDEIRMSEKEGAPAARRLGDTAGRSGLELKYDDHLRGVSGLRRVVRNRRGDVVFSEVMKEARHGQDLVLTLDLEIQQRAEALLDQALSTVTPAGTVDDQSTDGRESQPTCPQGGCLIAIDVHSGAILAAASAPRFNLNLLVNPDTRRWNELLEDPRKPLFSRATHMALAPGSVFKPVVAVAGLETGAINPDLPVTCRGYLDRSDQHRCLIYRHYRTGHGPIRLADALCQSCNVYFYTAARAMGPQPLVDWARRFGIGEPTGVDLPAEQSGHLPSPDELRQGVRRRWYPGDTLGLSIGQADLLVTPLQMVRAIAAIANDGQLVTPHLASGAGPTQLRDAASLPPGLMAPEPRPIAGLHTESLAHVREGMDRVVNHPTGTAFKTVHLSDVRIAGKTGTAESNGVDHAWFAGYVPADQPRIAFVVVLEHGGSGGKAAGPVARELVTCLKTMGLVGVATNLAGDAP